MHRMELAQGQAAVQPMQSFLGGVAERTNIEYRDVHMVLAQKKAAPKIILNNLSGAVKSGRLTALMGPSGSGKTSYVLSLCGTSVTTDSVCIGSSMF